MDLSGAGLIAHFSRLPAPWQRAFALAWEAFREGDVGIGAVVVDPAGSVVAAGRNRFRSRPTLPGEVAGGSLAHAELNALVQLPPGSYDDHTMLTTLEPCLLCTSALRLSHVGRVEYAAADPVWRGVERLPELSPHIARRWTARSGPMDGMLAQWAALLALLPYPERGEHGAVVDEYRSTAPELMALADRLVASGQLSKLRGLSLAEGFAAIGDLAA